MSLFHAMRTFLFKAWVFGIREIENVLGFNTNYFLIFVWVEKEVDLLSRFVPVYFFLMAAVFPVVSAVYRITLYFYGHRSRFADLLKKWCVEQKYPIPFYVIICDVLLPALMPSGLPMTFVLSSDGAFAFRHSGFVAWDGENTMRFLQDFF